MLKFLVLNGPNLNKLGTREPNVYGDKSLAAIEASIQAYGQSLGIVVECKQTASEGDIVDLLNSADRGYDGIILNPGAYTHYSIAIYDALKCTRVPTVEVHLSNVFARESFRTSMVTTSACIGQICGFGEDSYILAVSALKSLIEKSRKGQ